MVRPVKTILQGRLLRAGTFEIEGIAGERTVRAYIPPHNAKADPGRHPALVLFDGQNVFDDAPSYSGGWHLHEVLDRWATRAGKSTLPILLAIDHGGKNRINELGPWTDEKGGGHLDRFLEWLTSSLLPLMRERFGLVYGPKGIFVGGSSMGGLAALFAHLKYPQVFGGAMCMSPSLWFAKKAIFDFVKQADIPTTSRIYLDCGAREANGTLLRLTRQMADLLATRGYGCDRLMFRSELKGDHSEAAWRRRAPKAFRFLFTEPRDQRG